MILLPFLATRQQRAAFTVVEGVIAMGLLLMGVIAIYSGITFGFNTIRMARENTRATQILIEKTEQIRLFNWDQITSVTNTYLPTNDFFVSYYATNLGVTYTGRVTVATPSTVPSGYSTNMRAITVTVNWTTGSLPRTRSLTTYVSKYGLQNYIY